MRSNTRPLYVRYTEERKDVRVGTRDLPSEVLPVGGMEITGGTRVVSQPRVLTTNLDESLDRDTTMSPFITLYIETRFVPVVRNNRKYKDVNLDLVHHDLSGNVTDRSLLDEVAPGVSLKGPK